MLSSKADAKVSQNNWICESGKLGKQQTPLSSQLISHMKICHRLLHHLSNYLQSAVSISAELESFSNIACCVLWVSHF